MIDAALKKGKCYFGFVFLAIFRRFLRAPIRLRLQATFSWHTLIGK